MKRLSIAPAVCVSLALLVAGCSSDENSGSTSLGDTSSNGNTTTTGVSTAVTAASGVTTTTAATAVTAGTGTTVAPAATSTTAASGGRVVTSPSDNVRLGDSGAGVSQIQTALKALGYDLEPDGEFGPVTDRAVRDYQSKNSLSVDGVVGPKTWEKLGAGVNNSGATTTTTG